MKILICAVPPHKITATAHKIECDRLVIIGNKEPLKAWQRIPTADLCIVIASQVSTQGLHHVRRVFGKQYVSVPSLNEAIRVANDAVAAEAKRRAA